MSERMRLLLRLLIDLLEYPAEGSRAVAQKIDATLESLGPEPDARPVARPVVRPDARPVARPVVRPDAQNGPGQKNRRNRTGGPGRAGGRAGERSDRRADRRADERADWRVNEPADGRGDFERARAALAAMAERCRRISALELQEAHTAAFDLRPECSLCLAWHRYGDSPDQGRALAGLNELYRDYGFELLPGIPPDYLPVLLEFLLATPPEAGRVLLDGFGEQLYGLGRNLRGLDNIYAGLGEGLGLLAPAQSERPENSDSRTGGQTGGPRYRTDPPGPQAPLRSGPGPGPGEQRGQGERL